MMNIYKLFVTKYPERVLIQFNTEGEYLNMYILKVQDSEFCSSQDSNTFFILYGTQRTVLLVMVISTYYMEVLD